MTNPTSNYGFVLPTSTDLVTDLPADFEVALQGVDTRLKALQPGTTLGDIAYSSATANTNTRLPIGTSGQVLAVSGGGVPAWTTTADVTPLTTKGDLFTFTTADARLGVGTDGQTLVADSSTATGLKWATASSGGMTLLSTTTLSGTSTVVSSIDQTYERLYILVTGVTNNTANGSFFWRPNNTANLGTYRYPNGDTTVAASFGGDIIFESGALLYQSSSANNAASITIDNYASSTLRKPFSQTSTFVEVGGTDAVGSYALGGLKTTSAITSIGFHKAGGGSFTAGTVKIYGVK